MIEQLVVSPGVFRQIVRLENDCSGIDAFDKDRWERGLIYILGADRIEKMKVQQEQGATHQLKIDWSLA